MRKLIHLLLLIIIFPLITISAEENIESEILKEWRALTAKPHLSPGKTMSKPYKNNVNMSMFLNKVNKNWNNLSSSTQDMLKPILFRPTDILYVPDPTSFVSVTYNGANVISLDTTHFKIHYTKEGKNTATDAFAQTVADAFESSYSVGVTNKGFNPPPDDFSLAPERSSDNNGGDSKYDVYLIDIGQDFQGIFGWTQPEKSPSGNNDYVKYSFIVMDNDYATTGGQYNSTEQFATTQSPDNYARVTAAHEFFHAIQFSYNQNVDDWFLEASSVWFEDQTYPYIKDYIRYLNGTGRWFSVPEIPLDFDTTLNTHKYGSGIWPIFLENSKNYPGIIKDFFVDAGATANPNVFYILDNTLRTKRSTDLSSAFTKFTAWNYITGKNDDGKHYDSGTLYDTLYVYDTVLSDTEMSAPKTASTGKIPGYLGSNYLLFNKSGTSLRIMLNGSESFTSNLKWNAAVLIRSGATYIETTIALDNQNAGGINIDTAFDTVILIPSIYETAHLRSDLAKFPYLYGFSNDTTAPKPVPVLTAVDVPSDQGYYISLQWSASPDDSTDVESYDILRSTSSGTGFTVVNSINHGTYYNTDRVPLNRTNYYYKIRARDKWYNYETTGEKETTSVATDDLAPEPPTNVKAINTPKIEYGKSVDLTWKRSFDDGNGVNDIANYTIFRSTNRTDTASFLTTGVINAGHQIYQDTTGILNESTYYYYVRTEDGHPNYSYSTAYYFYNTTTTDTSHDVCVNAKDIWISPPKEFKAVGINDRIALAWKNPDVLDFNKIFIRKKTGLHPTDINDGTSIHDGTDSTFQDTDIIIGQTYYFTAISQDKTNNYSEPDDGSRAQAAVTLKAFNYPNPTYSGKTTIRYQLEDISGSEALLYIFDIAGELVLKIDNILNDPNNIQPVTGTPVYDFSWDGKNGRGNQVASGVYIFIIEANDNISKKDRTGKIAVIK